MRSIVSFLRKLTTAHRAPAACSECGTTLALQQWLGGERRAYICAACTIEHGYDEYLASLR